MRVRGLYFGSLLLIGLTFCNPKPVTPIEPPASSIPDPLNGTCLVDGSVQNFDSVRVYSFLSTNFEISFYVKQNAAIILNLHNQNSNNWPFYQYFPKGIGSYSVTSGGGAGTAFGYFNDFSSTGSLANQFQSGILTITQNDSINKRISGTFNNLKGFSSGKNHTFNNGEFKNAKAFYY